MSHSSEAVLRALADLASPRRALGDQLDELEQRRRHWVDELIVWFSPADDDYMRYASDSGGTEAPDEDELEEALREFVDGAEPDWHAIPIKFSRLRMSSGVFYEYDVVAALAGFRSEIDQDLGEVAAKVSEASERLDAAFVSVSDRLREWLDDVVTGTEATAGEWGRIQKAWRASLFLPMRGAALLLEVSSAAVARYETGARTQSLAALRSMVERLIEAGPTAGLDTARALRGLGLELSDITEADPGLIASIEDRLEALTTSQLRFVDALIADGQALDQFMLWISTAPTGVLRAATSSVATP